MNLNLNQLVKEKWYHLILLYALILPFGSALPNVLLGVLIFSWFFDLFTKQIDLSKNTIKWIIILTCFYLFYLISIMYSENTEYAFKKAKLQSILFLVPLIILTIRKHLNEKKIFNILQGSVFSTVVFSAISLFFALKSNFLNAEQPITSLLENNLSQAFVDLHYLEYSLLVALAMNLLVYIKFYKNQYAHKLLIKLFLPIALFLAVTLFLLNSISSIVITFSILFIQLFIYYKDKRTTTLIIIILAGSLLFIGNYNYNIKFRENVNDVVSLNDKKQWGGRGMRLLIWNSSIKVFKNHPVLGVGIGDQNDELTLIYKKYRIGQLLYKNNNFNAHNIFLQSLICSGIVGFLLFLMSLFSSTLFAIRKKNIIFIIFISIFILSGMINSFLQVNFGITFFAFFNSLLFILNFKDERITDS